MKNLSTETIEVEGKEYTLFLNRKGVVAFEKISKALETISNLEKKYYVDEDIEVDPNVNPVETYGTDSVEEDEKVIKNVFTKFYWIVLTENHHFNLEQTTEWFEKAINEYGSDQLISLAYQMIEDVNKVEEGTTELKKLKALRPKNTK